MNEDLIVERDFISEFRKENKTEFYHFVKHYDHSKHPIMRVRVERIELENYLCTLHFFEMIISRYIFLIYKIKSHTEKQMILIF